MINDASIYAASVVAVCSLPQLLYFLIKPHKKLPEELLHGKYLFLAILGIVSLAATILLCLFLSKSFGVIATFFSWIITSHTLIGLILLSWVWFVMHGYELRYMFKKIVLPCHMNILIVIVIILTIAFSLNYWAVIPFVIFSISSLLWSYKAYKLTKPAIDEDLPIREDYE